MTRSPAGADANGSRPVRDAERPLIISVAEAAALTGRRPRELYSWLARGEIPRDVFFRSGRAIWFKRPALEAWLGLRNGAGANDEAPGREDA